MSIRVHGERTAISDSVQSREQDAQRAAEMGNSMFRRTLTDVSNEVYVARLTELRNDIDRQGERLAGRVDVHEFEMYRKLIRVFLDEVVSNGYAFSKEDAYASKGKHRYVATVAVIDEKLDEIGKEVVKEHADKIEVLNKIDDIRGLLIDLLT